MYEHIEINPELIVANPEQPRQFFDPAAHQELVQSIKENGLLQPVVVRPVDGEGDARYMLIAGERRWRASKDAGLPVVPARVIKTTDDEHAFVLSISENVNRADMTITEEAGAYATLVAAGWDPKKIAKQFGKTETHIKWRLGLLTLCKEVAEWVNEGKIKPNLAWHVAQLSAGNQVMVASRYMRGDFDSEQDAVNFAQGIRMHEKQISLVAEKEPTVEQKEKRQQEKKKAQDRLSKVEEVLMPLLDELLKGKPEDLATILGAEVEVYLRKMDRLYNQVTAARRALRQAKGIAAAQNAALNDAIIADADEAKRPEKTGTKSVPAKQTTPKAPAAKTSLAAASPASPKPPVKKTPSAKPAASKPAGKKPGATGSSASRPAAKKADAPA